VVCDTLLESSQRELQVCFRPHFYWRSEQRVITPQSGGSLNQDSFGTPKRESWDKKTYLDVGAVERRREYYMGEGGGFPWVRVVVSLASLELFVAYLSTMWRAPKSRSETQLRVSQSQVTESWDLEARSRLPTLERGRGSSWEPSD
jgi:hypothetical protein